MKGFRTTDEDIKINEIAIELKKQFETEFNRYYCTKRYVKAFDLCILCINNMAEHGNRKYVYANAMLAIEKLTNRIEMTDKSKINQDKVIDALIQFGHKNMRVNENEIKVGQSKLSVIIGNKFEIEGKSNISKFTSILIVCIILFLGIFTAVCSSYFMEYILGFRDGTCFILGFILAFFVICGCLYFFYTKFITQHKTYIREIATSILYEYNKL